MNINEYVHLNPDVSAPILSLLWLAHRNNRFFIKEYQEIKHQSLQCHSGFLDCSCLIMSAMFISARLTKCGGPLASSNHR